MTRHEAADALRALADHREAEYHDDDAITSAAAKALAEYATPTAEGDPEPTEDIAEDALAEAYPETIREMADDIEAGREVLIETDFDA